MRVESPVDSSVMVDEAISDYSGPHLATDYHMMSQRKTIAPKKTPKKEKQNPTQIAVSHVVVQVSRFTVDYL